MRCDRQCFESFGAIADERRRPHDLDRPEPDADERRSVTQRKKRPVEEAKAHAALVPAELPPVLGAEPPDAGPLELPPDPELDPPEPLPLDAVVGAALPEAGALLFSPEAAGAFDAPSVFAGAEPVAGAGAPAAPDDFSDRESVL